MSLQSIHLRKLLRMMYSDERSRISLLRTDIREEIAKANGEISGGGDFFAPFWYDAKLHVLGRSDLSGAVGSRIDGNERRRNLYPQLRDGFLLWWNEKRRWTNEPFLAVEPPKGRVAFAQLGAVVKIDNILSVSDSLGVQHHVYPYFSEMPPLSDEAARLGLWALIKALPQIDPKEIRILDVIRGEPFSIDRIPLYGDEERTFFGKYSLLMNEWNRLWGEYE